MRHAAAAALAALALLACAVAASARAEDIAAAEAFLSRGDGHTSNWAVLVCASRYWFNYRHVANTLSMYRSVKRLGIPDSNIILMLADDVACNPRNSFPAVVFNDASHALDLYGANIEVDYRGYDVTVENFLRVLTGRHEGWVPRSKRLLSDARSNVLVYMTGHGGDEFLKFQDQVEISSMDIADALAQMAEKHRYREVLFMADTCQAATLAKHFYAPGVVAIGSSKLGEPSWSYLPDSQVGLSVIDRFTHYTLQFLERVNAASDATLAQLFDSYERRLLQSTATPRVDLFKRPLSDVRITDFFGAVTRVELTRGAYPGFVGAAEGEAGARAAAGAADGEEAAGGAGRDAAGAQAGQQHAAHRTAAADEL